MNTLTSYLNKYYKLQPQILLVYRDVESKSWSNRYFFLDEKYNPYTSYNHRSILNNEIVIEYDLEDKAENKRLALEVVKRLRSDNIKLALWYSGNKSYHIHLLVDIRSSRNVSLLKKTFIRHYTKGLPVPDLRLCSNNHLVRCEYGVHEKTGQKKTLINKDSNYPIVSDISPKIWEEYVEEVKNSINRRILTTAHSIIELEGFKYILKSHEFKDADDGRERAMFMLIHVLKDDYKDKKSEFIKFIQDWYRYSGGFKLSPKQIEHKVCYHWNRNYTISENYLNELLISIGKKELIK